MTQDFKNTPTPETAADPKIARWQEQIDRDIESCAGIITNILKNNEMANPAHHFLSVDPKTILNFCKDPHGQVLPADTSVLARFIPKYQEPNATDLEEYSKYAAVNYGTAPGPAMALIAQIANALQPQTAFVFGTARGRIEEVIAKKADKAEIVTLDIPTDLLDCADGRPDPNNIRYRVGIGIDDDSKIGDIFRNDKAISSRIHQLLGDSFTFKAGNLANTMQMIVVDGNHQFPNSLMDLANALSLAHTNGAVIIVDDFRKGSPMNAGVDAAAVLFSQITGLAVLTPCPKPREQGLKADTAVIVVPSDIQDKDSMVNRLRLMALQMKVPQ